MSISEAGEGGNPPQLTAVSLFSGLGGLDLGATRAHVRVVVANDTMREAETSYRRLLPEVEDFRLGPASKLQPLPKADLLLGGYPCQPFSMGGPRSPSRDPRSALYLDFARALGQVHPRFFVAENVRGLLSLSGRQLLDQHLAAFAEAGKGYRITFAVLRAEDFGVPQRRRRLFMVGVRRDLERFYHFPAPTHTVDGHNGTKRHRSHGEAIAHLDKWPVGEFYERPDDPEGHWSWYYMSRNRKTKWDKPSYTILANARHTPLHPASPAMRLAWSEINDGFKQGWEFTDQYDHLEGAPQRQPLEWPRRLSWRECALIQTLPQDFEPDGNLMRKIELIGNAVPPDLAQAVIEGLATGQRLLSEPPSGWGDGTLWRSPEDIKVPPAYGSTSPARRRVMQGNRSANTKPEDRVSKAIWARRMRYYKNQKVKLKRRSVTVDILCPRIRLAIFVDGCFWHGCPTHGHDPKSNQDYWAPKLERNKSRDRVVDAELEADGWTVVRIWEHEDPVTAAERIEPIYRRLREG